MTAAAVETSISWLEHATSTALSAIVTDASIARGIVSGKKRQTLLVGANYHSGNVNNNGNSENEIAYYNSSFNNNGNSDQYWSRMKQRQNSTNNGRMNNHRVLETKITQYNSGVNQTGNVNFASSTRT